MFDAIVSFLKSVFATQQRDVLLIPVRAEEKRDLLKPRR